MKARDLQLAYRELKESQARFRSLFEGSPDAIFLAASDGTIWAANPAACAMFGCVERELRALGRSGILDVNDSRYQPAMEERQRKGRIHGYELTAVRKNGERFPVEVDSVIIQSQPAQSFSVLRDITERKRREANLALLGDLAGEFARLSSADEIMQIVGAKVGSHLGISACVFAEVDETRDTATVQCAWRRTPDVPGLIGTHRISAFVSQEFLQAVRSGEIVVVRNTQTDPRTDAVNFASLGIYAYVCVPFRVGNEWRYLFAVNDSIPREWREDEIEFIREITKRTFPGIERVRAEETLRKSEARFRLLAQTSEKLLKSPDPQSVVNELCMEAMKFLDCQAFFHYLVDEANEGLRLNACAGIPELERQKIEKLGYDVAVCGSVARSGERIVAEDISNSSDPKTDFVRAYGIQAYCCHPLKTHDRLIGTLSFGTRTRSRFNELEIEVMRTIADHVAVAMQRVQAENSLRELNATLEQRVGERTVEITAMASQLRELASELTMTEQRERQRLAKVLHDHIQQMLAAAKLQTGILVNRQSSENLAASARLVNDLLDQALSASRTLTAELSPAVLYEGGLGPALQWLSRSFLEKHGLKVDVIFDSSGEPEIEDVRAFMFDAVREILFNVVKHSSADKARIEGFCEKDGRIWLSVFDRGCGFDPTSLKSGQKTEGFGLFSIQQRIKHMGGRLEIDSGPGLGTRVSLVGPPRLKPAQQTFSGARQKGQPNIPAEMLGRSGKIRIVLADDHHIIRQGLASLLRMEPDIEIVGEASDGSQAIALTHSLCPDVVIMDISMPGMNGIDATRQIHRDQPHVHVIGLSMHEEGELSSAILDAGAVAYVTKGGPSESLIAAIHKAVELRTGTSFGIM